MRRIFIILLLFGFPFSLVFAQKYVKFNVEEPELITTQSLRDFLSVRESPKIVVRYSDMEFDEDRFDLEYLYNIIEKEFLKGGYSVKDRILFDKVMNRTEDELDYSILQEKTDTELIFEIVRLETDLDYITDSYFNNKGIKTIFYKDEEVHVKGAKAEFKIIIIETNELAGNYVFHYAPCRNGCPFRFRDYEVVFEDDFGDKLPEDIYSEISQEQLEGFIQNSTYQLIKHLDQIIARGEDN